VFLEFFVEVIILIAEKEKENNVQLGVIHSLQYLLNFLNAHESVLELIHNKAVAIGLSTSVLVEQHLLQVYYLLQLIHLSSCGQVKTVLTHLFAAFVYL